MRRRPPSTLRALQGCAVPRPASTTDRLEETAPAVDTALALRHPPCRARRARGHAARSSPFFRNGAVKMRMIPALGLLILSTVTAAAQTSAIARTPDGRPDFQGIWINDTVTPLERPQLFADKEVLSEDEATRYEKDLI